MPNDTPGEGIDQKGIQQRPDGQVIYSPTPPNNPNTPPAQGVPDNGVKSAVQAIEDRVERAEMNACPADYNYNDAN